MFTNFIGSKTSMNIQNFSWGTVSWLHEPDYSSSERLSIGMAVFFPYKSQDIHTHTGEEQVLLCLEGKGEHVIDSRRIAIEPGMMIHCPPFCNHEVSNISDKPLKLLIIYSPSKQTELTHRVSSVIDGIEAVDIKDYIDGSTIAMLQNNFTGTLGAPVIILDESKEPISKTGFLKHCREKFSVIGDYCYKNYIKDKEDKQIFECCNGVKCVCAAVRLGDTTIGYILSGFIMSDQNKEGIGPLRGLSFDTAPISRIYSLLDSISYMADWLVEIILNSIVENEISQKNQRLAEEIKGRVELENALMNVKQQLMRNNLKIDTMTKSHGISLSSMDEYYYPAELEKEIIEALHEYKNEEIHKLLKKFREELGVNEINQHKAAFCELINSVLKSYDFDNETYNSLRRNAMKKIGQCNSDASLLECAKGTLNSINDYRHDEKSGKEPIIRSLIKYIDSNYDKKLTLEILADIVHISPNYLSNLFKDNTGMNISDYITNIRINKTKQLLVNTKLDIKEIAKRAGYGDVSYFCQLFKKREGMSPNKYRKEKESAKQ